MATKSKEKIVSDNQIIKCYMDEVLLNERFPKSVFKFCSDHKLQEEVFYQHFGSFEGLQKAIWEKFHLNTLALLQKNKEFDSYSNRDKMLTYFFTFFESLTLNRSYILFVLKEHRNVLKSAVQLKGLRMGYKVFVSALIQEANTEKNYKITRRSPQLFSEGAWVQLLFLLKFWMEDNSAAFEKTDMAIEKSVKTIFDVFENTPLESIIDFGKFLFKENFA